MTYEARALGPPFIFAYASFPDVSRLAKQSLIGGTHITRHNIRPVEALRAEISALHAGDPAIASDIAAA